MENKNHDNELDQLIRAGMEITDVPSPILNQRLKVNLYQREAAIKHQTPLRTIRLWYVPMILNFLMFTLFAVLALVAISNPILSKFAAVICAYCGLTGIIITMLGIKRANLKENIAVHIEKRGVILS